MAHNTVLDRHSSTPTGEFRLSTSEERAEFLRHLQALGVRPLGKPKPDGEQMARCWNRAKHANGDRTPSLSVNLRECVWFCQGCEQGGGLVGIRKAVGWTPKKSGRNSARLAAVEVLADFDVNPLDYLPESVLKELRTKTGRYKKDRTVTRHLRVMVAAACQMFRQAENETGFVFSRGVRFTAADARACGILPEVFTDFLPLLEAVGFTVTVGECGREKAHEATQKENGYLLATKLGLSPSGPSRQNPNRHEMPNPLTLQSPQTVRIPTRPRANAPQAVIAARLATKSDGRAWMSVRRSPALADLLVDLGTFSKVREVADGSTCQPGVRTIQELIEAHGPNVKRTIRKAEQMGLVDVARVAKAGPSARAGLVSLNEMGLHVIERDIANGRERMETEAERIRAAWRDYIERRREAEKLKREQARESFDISERAV